MVTLNIAFGNTDAFVGLPWGGIIALVLTVIYLVARRVVGFREAMGCIPKGFQAMISPIIILTLAVSLKTTLNHVRISGNDRVYENVIRQNATLVFSRNTGCRASTAI